MDDFKALAQTNNCLIYVPSGAIAGIDAVKGAMIAEISKATLTTRKPQQDRRTGKNQKNLSMMLKNPKAPKFSDIFDRWAKSQDLEGGIYDLAIAAKFGPLDTEANSAREWARLYIVGLSFWEVHPEQAVFYFGQVASSAPYLLHESVPELYPVKLTKVSPSVTGV